MRYYFSFLIGLVAFTFLAGQSRADQPNIVVILADDIGLGDLSEYRRMAGLEVIVETPNLDRLMAEGLSFTDAHSPTALCAPSRYAIMTGNNPYHSYAPWGVWGAYQESPIKEEDMTLGKLMQQANYQTAFFGKWHLGGDYYRLDDSSTIYRGGRSQKEMNVDIRRIVGGGPQSRGFDYSFTFPAGIQNVPYAVFENGNWMPLATSSKITDITQARAASLGFKLDKSEGLGDSNWNAYDMGPLLVGKAVDYIAEAKKEIPFFIYYCSQAVHLPHTPPEELDGQKVRNVSPTCHLDMVKELDVQVGMIVKALKKKGVFENTLLVFTSDNGGLLRKESLAAGHNSAGTLRGGKNQIFEGGHRVPFIAVWPNQIAPGEISEDLVSGTDLMATLARLTDQPLAPHQGMDSQNFLPALLGKKNPERRKFLMIQGGTQNEVVYREGRWKLIMKYDRKTSATTPMSLFDLRNNLTESLDGDLISAPGQQNRIRKMWEKYEDTRSGLKRTGSLLKEGV